MPANSEKSNSTDLFYWAREKKQSSAEVDYVIQHQGSIIPIEVKAGKTGTLRSLHSFMHNKKAALAVRFYSSIPQKDHISAKLPSGEKVDYDLISLPHYLVGQFSRLLSF